MFSLFTKEPKGERTVVLLDVESGSAGAALLRLSPRQAPRLMGEWRAHAPVLATVHSSALAAPLRRAMSDVLARASEAAARLRQQRDESLAKLGAVREAHVFFAAPWSAAQAGEGGITFAHEPLLAADARSALELSFADLPVEQHAYSAAAAHAGRMFEQDELKLVLLITGEVGEILLIRGGRVVGHGSIPLGSHLLVRTLAAHAGLHSEEARSALRLAHQETPLAAELSEPLRAAASDVARDFLAVASELAGESLVRSVIVMGPEPMAEWFARALSQSNLFELFPAGGTVRALRPKHLRDHFSGHSATPDLPLMLEALYVHTAPGVRARGGI